MAFLLQRSLTLGSILLHRMIHSASCASVPVEVSTRPGAAVLLKDYIIALAAFHKPVPESM
jgi:hypothetical protein